MSASWMPPALAAAGVAAASAAVALREAPVLAGIASPTGGTSGVVERVGALRVVRWLTAADRLASSLPGGSARRSVERVAGWAALAAAAAVVCGVIVGRPALALAFVAAAVIVRGPSFAAGRAARRRVRAIDRDVPLLLDVVSLGAYAGLPPPAALERAVRVVEGPLADEVAAALADVDLGARWRDRLRRLAEEVPADDLRRTISVLVRSEAIGTPTVEPILILADEVRAARRSAAAERARKAPVQMLFPLVFLVLPAFLLLTVVPVLVATLGSIR